MRKRRRRRPSARFLEPEALEPRLVMSAASTFDPNLGDIFQQPWELVPGDVDVTLADVHGTTGLQQAREMYGLTGMGQTVAVIDTGVAYDHYALGGGLGSEYRVVGGWDFTEEKDADPYDDGPTGFHGTHVAGIIGSSDSKHQGVAPEVDIVALRVFNDLGMGYFQWVEQALRWVHTHRDDFEYPITTVNLSLGSQWNSYSIPGWAMLEDEFAQLERDGIFISVAAGNSFGSYRAPGLSYPAASPHVVPVASVSNYGQLSGFSQRNGRVIAAPGEWITSTVPDYLFDFNGLPDDFATASGTSMAAPYVAGASMILREAMEIVGYENITQSTLYELMRDTADLFFDPATGANYHRLNMSRALEAVLPEDDYGSTLDAAHDLGVLTDSLSIAGMIGQTDDQDFFRFTAGYTGTVTFGAGATHNLAPEYGLVGGGGIRHAETLAFDVVAGQSYTVRLETTAGIGKYEANVQLQPAMSDWGTIDFRRIQPQNIGHDETWHQFTVQRSGRLTVEALYDRETGDVNIELYDANQRLLASNGPATNGQRMDVRVTSGDRYYLRVLGTNSNVSFRLSNQVSQIGGHVYVYGTSGEETFVLSAGSEHRLIVNGVDHSFDASAVHAFSFIAGDGADAVRINGTRGDETAVLRGATVDLRGEGYRVYAEGIEDIQVNGGGGFDRAVLYDSETDDWFSARPGHVVMQSDGVSSTVDAFEHVDAYATAGGEDRAHLYGSTGDDRFIARADRGYSVLVGEGFQNMARGFDRVDAYANSGGYDRAQLYDSSGDDRFIARADRGYSVLFGEGFQDTVRGFDRVDAYAKSGGYDRAQLYDSSGDDRFIARADRGYSVLFGEGFQDMAQGFDRVDAYANSGGYDRAQLYDSLGDDRFIARADRGYSVLVGEGFQDIARGFDRVDAYANSGGYDRAQLYDSVGDDRFIARADDGYSVLFGEGFQDMARGFDRVDAYARSGGYDRAQLYDSVGDDRFIARADDGYSVLFGEGFQDLARGFDRVDAYAKSGGYDRAQLYDSVGDDRFIARADDGYSVLFGEGFQDLARGFDRVDAYAKSGGYDRAQLYDSVGDDRFIARADDGYSVLAGEGFQNTARGFDRVDAYAKSGGYDQAQLYDSLGDDRFIARADDGSSVLVGEGFHNMARGFEHVEAYAKSGGYDRAHLYSYDTVATDRFVGSNRSVCLLHPLSTQRVHGYVGAVMHRPESANVPLQLLAVDCLFERFDSGL